MNSSQFKKNELKKLCAIIGFKPSVIETIVSDIDRYYKNWTETKIDKKTGNKKTYKDGSPKVRNIRPSVGELKVIQRNIKERILEPIALPDNVHGGVKGRSNITNAKCHQGKKFMFTVDLQEFYPNIGFQMVYATFIRLRFSPHYARWLTKLTTWKYELPQGAPTSTHIANLVFMKTDFQLIEFCQGRQITYTRYVDDLTFSSQKDFRPLLNDILSIVTTNGFKINYRKIEYSGNQTLTGIDVFLHKIDAPHTIVERSRIEIETSADKKPVTNYLNNIRKTNSRKININKIG